MADRLRKYFPMIRTREEVIEEIQSKSELTAIFQRWTEEQQEEFLDFCTGVRGVKILYDGFFKAVMDPDAAPERLEDFISQVLDQRVKIVKVLPIESRIAEETALSVLDIVVQLENNSLINVEVQKIGYSFPGQRCACYSADLLLRQYKRLRSEKGKKFTYKDVKSVYTIVLFEHSPGEFRDFPEDYVHRIEATSNTGIRIDLLQKYVFLPLDIFKEHRHNKTIRNKLDGWLTFFSTDEPETVERLIDIYPEFIPMYQEIYTICRNMENVMEFYSEELKIMDRNTVLYMIDEMQDTIDAQKKKLDQKEAEIDNQKVKLNQQKGELDAQKEKLSENAAVIRDMQREIERLKALLDEK